MAPVPSINVPTSSSSSPPSPPPARVQPSKPMATLGRFQRAAGNVIDRFFPQKPTRIRNLLTLGNMTPQLLLPSQITGSNNSYDSIPGEANAAVDPGIERRAALLPPQMSTSGFSSDALRKAQEQIAALKSESLKKLAQKPFGSVKQAIAENGVSLYFEMLGNYKIRDSKTGEGFGESSDTMTLRSFPSFREAIQHVIERSREVGSRSHADMARFASLFPVNSHEVPYYYMNEKRLNQLPPSEARKHFDQDRTIEKDYFKDIADIDFAIEHGLVHPDHDEDRVITVADGRQA